MSDTDKAIQTCKEALDFAKENSIRLSYEEKAKILQRIAAAHLKAGEEAKAMDAWKDAQVRLYLIVFKICIVSSLFGAYFTYSLNYIFEFR